MKEGEPKETPGIISAVLHALRRKIAGSISLKLLDPKSETPFLFSPCDEVRFIVEDDCLAP